ncbi:MAG: D-alanyl-D-alanine carboxypeptidase/D-alanyl-D-alanine-endopeptidase [Bryobacteraceae bacterium]|nr:D-alanyl-D-alanine carboxypeptidase/D-alanyl-D-alanine-endopeptidase [Bryobacteraceae bacterium]
MRLLLPLLLAATLAAAPPLKREIDKLLASTPMSARAHWGIRAVRLDTGKVLYERQAKSFFTPASNTKLFSTALALSRLGPEYRFKTRILAAGAPDAQGRLPGDLRLVGGGDPTLTARTFPYEKGPAKGDPLRALDELASQVAARGVRVIEGDIVGDDRAYPWEPYPDGWGIQDMVWEYGAPVSALTINDNAIRLRVRPTAPGQPALVTLDPPLDHYVLHDRVLTVDTPDARVDVDRLPGSSELRVAGTLRAGGIGYSTLVAIDDPALYAARAFKEALTRRGIAVRGRPRALHRLPGEILPEPEPAVTIAERESPPLVEVLKVIDKVSQNLYAELVLREVARVRRGDAARPAALEELRAFLAEAGVPKDDYRFEDASGLSRLTLITPEVVTTLLTYMAKSPHAQPWFDLMPVGGVDGTLENRFKDLPDGKRVAAKTGSLSHVNALGGYALTRKGRRVAFSIVVNAYRGPASEARAIIDKIAVLFANAD